MRAICTTITLIVVNAAVMVSLRETDGAGLFNRSVMTFIGLVGFLFLLVVHKAYEVVHSSLMRRRASRLKSQPGTAHRRSKGRPRLSAYLASRGDRTPLRRTRSPGELIDGLTITGLVCYVLGMALLFAMLHGGWLGNGVIMVFLLIPIYGGLPVALWGLFVATPRVIWRRRQEQASLLSGGKGSLQEELA